MQLRQHVRQLRRIQSLRFRVLKSESNPDKHPHSVLQSPGFHKSFDHWVSSHPELNPAQYYLPGVDYLSDVGQLLKRSVDDKVYHINQRAEKLAAYQRQRDITKYGKKSAFGMVKETGTGLVTSSDS